MFKKLLAVPAMLAVSATSSLAAIDALTLTDIEAGIAGSDVTYYQIGGAILVVLAGIWGFRLVKRLLG